VSLCIGEISRQSKVGHVVSDWLQFRIPPPQAHMKVGTALHLPFTPICILVACIPSVRELERDGVGLPTWVHSPRAVVNIFIE